METDLSSKTDWPYLVACCLVFLACIAIAGPFANSAFDDDWSYSHVAFQLAQTGHFHYDGWGSPSIVFQSVLAAIGIRIFGFSFNLLRFVSLPFSLAFVLLSYQLGRKIGLTQHFALFAALIVATSPLFIPLASTFMTEPYACCFSLLCIYAALSSADAPDSFGAKKWLWILAASGILGGSDRQTVWTAPIVLIPYLLWKRSSDRNFKVHGVFALAVCLISLVLVVHNFSPPYAPTSLSHDELLSIFVKNAFAAAFRVAGVLTVSAMLSLPAFFCAQKIWKKLTARQLAVITLVCLIAVCVLRLRPTGIVPYLGNIITVSGVLSAGTEGLGLKPLLLTRPIQYGLTFIVLFVVALWVFLLWRKQLRMRLSNSSIVVLLLFTCAYIPLMIPGGLTHFIYDRYALPLLPLIVICVLLSIQSAATKIPIAAYLCLSVFAGYAIVTTHDYFATLRARAAAADTLEKRGVPRRLFSIGFEHDGWTQVQLTGKIKPTIFGVRPGENTKYWFWSYTPVIQPKYVAVGFPATDRVQNEILQIPYTTWTKPFRRKIAIVKEADIPKQY